MEYVKKHLPFYLKYVQLFSDNSIHGNNVLQVFSKILRLILRICDTDLAPSYNEFLTCVLSIFPVQSHQAPSHVKHILKFNIHLRRITSATGMDQIKFC